MATDGGTSGCAHPPRYSTCTNATRAADLRELTDRYNGDMQTALAAYRGPTALARAPSEPEVVVEYRRRINEQLDILRPTTSTYPESEAAIIAPVAPAQRPRKAPSLGPLQPQCLQQSRPIADSAVPEVAITQAKTAESVISQHRRNLHHRAATARTAVAVTEHPSSRKTRAALL